MLRHSLWNSSSFGSWHGLLLLQTVSTSSSCQWLFPVLLWGQRATLCHKTNAPSYELLCHRTGTFSPQCLPTQANTAVLPSLVFAALELSFPQIMWRVCVSVCVCVCVRPKSCDPSLNQELKRRPWGNYGQTTSGSVTLTDVHVISFSSRWLWRVSFLLKKQQWLSLLAYTILLMSQKQCNYNLKSLHGWILGAKTF